MGFRVWCSKVLIKEGRGVNGAVMCQITSQRAVDHLLMLARRKEIFPHENIMKRTVKEIIISTAVKCEVYVTAV